MARRRSPAPRSSPSVLHGRALRSTARTARDRIPALLPRSVRCSRSARDATGFEVKSPHRCKRLSLLRVRLRRLIGVSYGLRRRCRDVVAPDGARVDCSRRVGYHPRRVDTRSDVVATRGTTNAVRRAPRSSAFALSAGLQSLTCGRAAPQPEEAGWWQSCPCARRRSPQRYQSAPRRRGDDVAAHSSPEPLDRLVNA